MTPETAVPLEVLCAPAQSTPFSKTQLFDGGGGRGRGKGVCAVATHFASTNVESIYFTTSAAIGLSTRPAPWHTTTSDDNINTFATIVFFFPLSFLIQEIEDKGRKE